MPGVTPTGFEIKTLKQIQADIESRQRAAPALGETQDYSEHGPLGQINGIMSGTFAELWELLGALHANGDPNAAQDYALTVIASLTGTERRPATRTTVQATVQLEAGVLVPPLARVSVMGRPDLVWELDPVVHPSGIENAAATTVTLPAKFRSLETGPVPLSIGTLQVIDTVTAGWLTVNNPTAAVIGRVSDNDITLRQRREDQLALRGGSTTAAIRADLLDTETHADFATIEAVEVYENTSDVFANGLPPHSFEVVIDDGTAPSVSDDVIAQSIHENKPAGIRAIGSSSGNAIDQDGNAVEVAFSRRTGRDVYVALTVMVGEDFPADGPAQIKAAIVAQGGELGIGDDVIALKLRASAFMVAGVLDVPTFALDFTVSPVATANLSIGDRERALFDAARIEVTVA